MYFIKQLKFKINIIKRYYCTNNRLKPPWNVLFFGSDEFSVASLRKLKEECENCRLLSKLEVVTGAKTNLVKTYALKEKLKIHSWPIEVSKSHDFHLGIVVSFGHLIPERIINMFPFGMINIHASLLPRWRGAAPIIYAIANGDKITGVTIMKIKADKFDVGEILMQKQINLDDTITQPELYKTLSELGANALLECLNDLPKALANCKEQPQEGVTLAPRIKPTIANISWDKMSAEETYNLSRALCGIYHLTTKWEQTTVKLINMKRCMINKIEPIVPGKVIFNRNENVLNVQCRDGCWISVEKIGIYNKKPMSAKDFNNGYIQKLKIANVIFK